VVLDIIYAIAYLQYDQAFRYFDIYGMSQEERSVFWAVIVLVIVNKEVPNC
jgi:hypothetical protein